MDAERIAELKRLCDEATPPPWHQTQVEDCDDDLITVGEMQWDTEIGRFYNSEDAALASAARTALPEALAYIAERNEMIDALQREIVALREDVEKAVAAERARCRKAVREVRDFPGFGWVSACLAIDNRIRAGEQEG